MKRSKQNGDETVTRATFFGEQFSRGTSRQMPTPATFQS